MSRSGADLAQLLLGGFNALADRVSAELAARGYEEIRPAQEFALQAILSGAGNVSDLGRRLSVTKQAAAKTVALLQERRYVAREPDPADKRRMRLYVTDHGLAMLHEGEEIFDQLRSEWQERVGAAALSHVETTLRQLVGDGGAGRDAPAWTMQESET